MSSSHDLSALTDSILLTELAELVRRDHQHTARLLRYLDEVDRRELWARLGHPSMFDFCVVRFHMSESEAGKRIGAARAARRLPALFEMVARGELHLSGIHRLKAHLTEDNHRDLLAEAKHKTIKEIEQLVARLSPQPDVPSRLRALPAPRLAARDDAPAQTTLPSTPPAAVTRRSPDPKPLSPRRYKLEVTLDEEARGELQELQDLLGHQVPDGDPAEIVKRALHALLEQTRKKKAAAADWPRGPRSPRDKSRGQSRAIPAAVRRAVWERDQGRCAFVGEDGRRCGETRQLEYAHARPWGKGGEHSVDNVGLRCRGHNAYEARRDYGVDFMASKPKRKPDTVREPCTDYVPLGRAAMQDGAGHALVPLALTAEGRESGTPKGPARPEPRPVRTTNVRLGGREGAGSPRPRFVPQRGRPRRRDQADLCGLAEQGARSTCSIRSPCGCPDPSADGRSWPALPLCPLKGAAPRSLADVSK